MKRNFPLTYTLASVYGLCGLLAVTLWSTGRRLDVSRIIFAEQTDGLLEGGQNETNTTVVVVADHEDEDSSPPQQKRPPRRGPSIFFGIKSGASEQEFQRRAERRNSTCASYYAAHDVGYKFMVGRPYEKGHQLHGHNQGAWDTEWERHHAANLTAEAEAHGDMVMLAIRDQYMSLPDKTWLSLEYMWNYETDNDYLGLHDTPSSPSPGSRASGSLATSSRSSSTPWVSTPRMISNALAAHARSSPISWSATRRIRISPPSR